MRVLARGPLLRCVCLGALAFAGAGCKKFLQQEYPGDSLGKFRVHGSLVEQSCGSAAIMPRDPLEFDVELRRDGATAYWRLAGQPAKSGHYDADTFQFTFQFATSYPLRPADELQMLGPCTLGQVEEVTGTVPPLETPAGDASAYDAAEAYDAGDGDGGAAVERHWTGENTITFAPTSGSDCSDVIGTDSGHFQSLPCRVRYELEARETEHASAW